MLSITEMRKVFTRRASSSGSLDSDDEVDLPGGFGPRPFGTPSRTARPRGLAREDSQLAVGGQPLGRYATLLAPLTGSQRGTRRYTHILEAVDG
jgi:hypothetical protein